MYADFTFFSRQHVGLKAIFTLLAIFFFSALPVSQSLLFCVFLALYYSLDAPFWRIFPRVLLRLIPFFISYFLMGILFSLDFYQQLHTAFRICAILSLSVYAIASTPPQRIFHDADPLLRFPLFRDACIFFAATVSFVPLFQDAYRSVPAGTSLLAKSLRAVQQVFETLTTIEKEVYGQLNVHQTTDTRGLMPNMAIVIMIIIQTALYLILRY